MAKHVADTCLFVLKKTVSIFSLSLKSHSLMEKAGNLNGEDLTNAIIFHPDFGNSSTWWH